MLDEPLLRRESLEQEAMRKGLEDAALAHHLFQPSDHWLLRYSKAYLKGRALFIKLQEDMDDLFSRAKGRADPSGGSSAEAGKDGAEASQTLTLRERRRLRREKKKAATSAAPKASFARRIAVPTVTFVGLLPALATALHLTFPTMSEAAMAAVVNSFNGSDIDKAHTAVEDRLACSMHVPIVGSSGTSQVFWGPEAGCRVFSDGFGQGELRTATVSPADAERFASIIEVVEGEHRAGRSTILGINLKGLLRALKSRVERMVIEAPRQGGSSPILSAVEVLFGAQVGVSSEQKLEMMEVTALLSAGPLADDAARDQFVTAVLPVAVGAPGSQFGAQISGGMVPVVIFGKKYFSELELFELCVAAAAIKRPVMVVGPETNADGRLKAAERLQYVKARAHSQCLTPLLDQGEIDQNEFDDQLSKLRGWEVLSSQRSASVNPTDFQNSFPGMYTLVADQLRLNPELAALGELRLHTNSEGQHRLTEAVQEVLDKHAASPQGRRNDLDVVSIAVRHEGGAPAIVAAYQNRRELWFGRIEDSGDQAVRGVPMRSVASTLKGLLVPQFLLRGVADAICRRAVKGFQDANGYQGDDCSDPRKARTLEVIIGESSNLGIAEAILRTGVDQIGGWLEALGASIQPQPTETLTAIGFTTGSKAVLSPERLARGYVAIARGAWGDTSVASDPTLFASQTGEELDLSQYGISDSDWVRTASVLQAPMNTSTGTLRKMSQFVKALGCDVDTVLAKSGTSESTFENARGQQRDVRDRLVVLSAQCDGTAYTVVSIVGTQDIETPLRSIDAIDVMTLAATNLAVAMDANQPSEKGLNMPGRGFIFALTFALGCLLFLSFATSGYGLWEMLSSQHGVGEDFLGTFWGGLVLIAAATMISGIIQVLIGGFWNSAAVPTLGLGVRSVCGTVGAFTSLVSAGLATAFYTLVLPVADDIVVFRNDQAFANIAEPLVAFSGDMQQIGVGMEALAASMVASQDLERRGKSCDGPPAAPGKGPRWQMRVRLTGEASELSLKATALANDALDTAKLPPSVDDAVMQSAFSRARSLSIDPRLRELKSWVQGTLDDFQNGFTDPTAGTFVCRDRSVEEELSTFLTLLDEPISLPAVPPRAETFDFADSLENSYSGIFGSLAALVGIEGVRNDDEFEKTKPALMIALAVEAFIIVLTFLRVWLTQPKKPAGPRRKRYGKAAPKPRGNRLKPEIALAYSADVELFSRLIEPVGPGQRMFFVPKNGDKEVAHKARSLADEWSMQIMPGGSSMDVSLHAPSRQEGLSDATGGATVFDVYEVPYLALKWLQQTSRDLAETRLHEEGLTP